ncbi:ketoacyl-ACP synthase III [Massilia yuzhufengensis]|uniref:3-oxoacyl-[acyl-carrier-protein] synthase-3 n=1 Tax=Massilia yuzhufengensis TaxID=1164594 RepID=A0A1I1G5W5_9BURK|nr:ketoacyl-ACP synthase III [Massilia yuzhufengensis]SFC06732.1 3-oxoacyl-[acyl-carrier-protein] synthase-3 [Massilia yuzhufengensis]
MASSSGREALTRGARIAGVVSCLPRQALDNASFAAGFGDKAVEDVVKLIGVQSRRRAAPGDTTRDLCRDAGARLLAGLGWTPESVDAIVFVSQTPDYRLPATACALQAELGVSPACIAFDVNLGCSGYPYGLWLAMTMVQGGAARRVLLAVGDTISRIVDPQDRATALLFGDAGTVTAIEAGGPADAAHFILGTDGRGAANLIVPQGAFRAPVPGGDARLDGRKLDTLYMDGGEIFNFTLRAVPPLVARSFEHADAPMESYDAFLFHQANLFMLKHLAKKARLPLEKTPMNIDRYGNTSSASIPLLMTTDLAQALRSAPRKLAMFGFGVGYSWASASLTAGPLQVCETIQR